MSQLITLGFTIFVLKQNSTCEMRTFILMIRAGATVMLHQPIWRKNKNTQGRTGYILNLLRNSNVASAEGNTPLFFNLFGYQFSSPNSR